MKPVFMQRTQILRKNSPTVVLLQMLVICVPLCAQPRINWPPAVYMSSSGAGGSGRLQLVLGLGHARFGQFEDNGKIDKAARTVTAEDCPLRLDRAVFLPDLARDPGAVWALRERFFLIFFGWPESL